MGRPLRRPFLPVEPRNLWPKDTWPFVPNIGAARNVGNAGGGYSYQIGMPTQWALYDDGTNARWDWNFGSHGGEPYFDWRWWDDFNWGSTFNDLVCGTANSLVPCVVGQQFEVGYYLAFAPGTNAFPSSLGVVWDEYNGSFAYQATVINAIISSPSTQISRDIYQPTRVAATMTVLAGGATLLTPGVYTNWGAQVSTDQCILRVYKPFIRRVT